MLLANLVKIEKQKYHSIETVPKYDKKVIDTEVKSIRQYNLRLQKQAT
jgi:hypothetical protein